MLGVTQLAPGTYILAIVAASAIAGTLAAMVTARGIVVPVVVVELLLGVLLGPQLLGLHVTQLVAFFADLGLGLLFFFAGYEIDLRRIKGEPLRLALFGWGLSLLLAYSVGGVLACHWHRALAALHRLRAATTAIGTLIPILSDSGELRTRFGTICLPRGLSASSGRSAAHAHPLPPRARCTTRSF